MYNKIGLEYLEAIDTGCILKRDRWMLALAGIYLLDLLVSKHLSKFYDIVHYYFPERNSNLKRCMHLQQNQTAQASAMTRVFFFFNEYKFTVENKTNNIQKEFDVVVSNGYQPVNSR